MDNQLTTLDKAVKVSIIVGAMVVALSIAYYLVIFLPKKEEMRIDQQRQEQSEREQKEREAIDKSEIEKTKHATALNNCLSIAQNNYSSVWGANCKSNAKKISAGIASCKESSLSDADCRSIWGVSDASASCSLPLDLAKNIEDSLKQYKDECFKKYPQK